MANTIYPEKMDVIIIGGSISGLLHGIMLKSLGHNVTILEQQASDRSDYGAGMGTGPEGKKFLQEYDPTGDAIAYDCPGFKFLGKENEVKGLMSSPMYLTSWTALYYRLRGLFDGLESVYFDTKAGNDEQTGQASFQTRKRVVNVTSLSKDLLKVEFEDLDDGTKSLGSLAAHLVIDASGPYSIIRSSLLPRTPPPRYAGFIAWRGTVPDTLVSEETNALFTDRFNLYPMAGGNYCIGYAVPGKTGSFERGRRQLNWIWYTTTSDYDSILTDIDGHKHANSVPRGKLNMLEWTKRRDAILPKMNKAFAELMLATAEPFVSTIRESYISQRSFYDGKLLLVGDGASLMRPNAGQAMNHAAVSCLALRDVLQGKFTLGEWEVYVKEEGWRMRLFSNSIAERFLGGSGWEGWWLGVYVRWLEWKRWGMGRARL